MPKLTYINLSDLHIPCFQARGNLSIDLIREISDSIKSIGVIEPLIVRKLDDGFEIVAGCVRYHAASLAGLKAVPCIVMSLDDKDSEILKLHENIKRIPLDHIDQGQTFIMMIETFSMTEQAVADSVGRSVGYVSQHISLVRINNELTEAVKDGSISFSQARELMRLDDATERKRLLLYCKNDGATVQVLQRWVQDSLRSNSVIPPVSNPEPSQHYDYNDAQVSRNCEACGKSVDINIIRQVFYCPECYNAIKSAISEEISKNSPNSTH